MKKLSIFFYLLLMSNQLWSITQLRPKNSTRPIISQEGTVVRQNLLSSVYGKSAFVKKKGKKKYQPRNFNQFLSNQKDQAFDLAKKQVFGLTRQRNILSQQKRNLNATVKSLQKSLQDEAKKILKEAGNNFLNSLKSSVTGKKPKPSKKLNIQKRTLSIVNNKFKSFN